MTAPRSVVIDGTLYVPVARRDLDADASGQYAAEADPLPLLDVSDLPGAPDEDG